MTPAEPTVTEAFGAAWHHLKRTLVPLLVLTVIWMLLLMPAGRLHGVAALLYSALVAGPIGIGGSWACLRTVRGAMPEVPDLFTAYRGDVAQAFLASLLTSGAIAISLGTASAGLLLALFGPLGAVLGFAAWVAGAVAVVRLSWVPYLLIDERLDAVGALRESWERTRGHGVAIAGIWLLGGLLVGLGLALLVLPAIPAMAWLQLAQAWYYAVVTDRRRGTASTGPSTILESQLVPGGTFGGPPPHEPPRR